MPLDSSLSSAFEVGRASWAGAKLDFPTFARRAAALDVRSEELTARAADVFLAWACAEQDTMALAYFEERFLPAVDGYIGRLGLAKSVVDEVKQELRIRLLVGKDPRIGQYGGRGPLAAFVRVAATRVALSMLKQTKQRAGSNDLTALGALVGDGTNPELAAVRHRHGNAFQAALEKSLDALEARDKTLLRMHFIDQLNIDAIGRIYRVHRATVARWLVGIRHRVLENLRTELSLNVQTTTSEFQSMLTALRPDLELSLHRLLQAQSADPNQ